MIKFEDIGIGSQQSGPPSSSTLPHPVLAFPIYAFEQSQRRSAAQIAGGRPNGKAGCGNDG